MRASSWRNIVPCVVVGGVALLAWHLTHRKVDINIKWPQRVSPQAKTLLSLGLLEQSKTFSIEARRSLVRQLIELGYLPHVSKDYAELDEFDKRYEELLAALERELVLPPEQPET